LRRTRTTNVFGRYAAILMTFLSSALFFSTERSADDYSFSLALLGVLIEAMFANVVLLPFKYFLPCVAKFLLCVCVRVCLCACGYLCARSRACVCALRVYMR
jgi:hypothetical protein